MKKGSKIIKKIILYYFIYIIVTGILIFKIPYYKKSNLNYNINDLNETSEVELRANIIDTNKEALDYRLSVINEAKEEINLLYYHFYSDKSGKIILGSLLNKAREGVKVLIVVDGKFFKNDKYFKTINSHPNVEIKTFEKKDFLMPHRNNNSLHDKLLAVDNNYGITGGRNINDRFLFNNNITTDRDVLLFNENYDVKPVIDMNSYIKEVSTSKYVRNVSKKNNEKANIRLISDYNEYYKNELVYDKDKIISESTIIDNAMFLRSPNNRFNKEPVIMKVFNELIETNDENILQSPYITKSYMMKRDFNNNKKVTLLTNNFNTNPNLPSQLSYLNIRKKLAKKHNLYEIQSTYSHHSKSAIFGDEIIYIGSLNLDSRSMYLSSESGFLIKGEDFNLKLRDSFNLLFDESAKVLPNGKYEETDVLLVRKKYLKYILVRPFSYLSFLVEEML